ncbi:MAG: isoprenyl transferase [Eubacteriales bacterium]|nr:isoprenyl transferase [Eubacteriales bacterium]MDY3332992.1 isoprenyl transferase [Gallibacter sp.]
MAKEKKFPKHIAMIMDGNGRWATNRGKSRVFGHNAGMKAMKNIVKHCGDIGLEYLTVYAFSTENWKRSQEEVSGIFGLLIKYIDSELASLHKNNVRVNILGDFSIMEDAVKNRLEKTIELTKNNSGLIFNIALNYGSRAEILMAAKSLAFDYKNNLLKGDDINEEEFSKRLFTGILDIPDPDLVIRTSGEIRLSNFLMWQLAYSEMAFTDTLWPDFKPEELDEIIQDYMYRERRFGGRL